MVHSLTDEGDVENKIIMVCVCPVIMHSIGKAHSYQ